MRAKITSAKSQHGDGEQLSGNNSQRLDNMADEEKDGPIEHLAAARQFAVQVRRELASTLKEGNRSVLSDTHRRQLVQTQLAIEAIDQAIADEKELAKDTPKQSSKK